jgi:hypothetical protein
MTILQTLLRRMRSYVEMPNEGQIGAFQLGQNDCALLLAELDRLQSAAGAVTSGNTVAAIKALLRTPEGLQQLKAATDG